MEQPLREDVVMARYPAELTAARHEKILVAASRLFREHGFGGVSVARIMGAAGLTHGGFYDHFGSKEELAAAGLQKALEDMLVLVERAAASADPDHVLVTEYLSRRHRDHPEQGCAVAALAPEVARHSGALRDVFTDRLGTLIDRLTHSRAAHADRSTRSEAIAMFATLLGTVVLARAVDDPNLSDEILAAGRATFGVAPETV